MKKEKKFYVYGLYEEKNLKPFYIGKSNTYTHRFTNHIYAAKCGEVSLVYNKIRKLLKEEIYFYERPLKYFNNESSTLELEIKLIQLLGKIKDGGCLYNTTDGGDGIGGWKHSEETKIKMRRSSFWDEESLNKMKDLYAKGFGFESIGSNFGLDGTTIAYRFKILGIETRNSKEASNAACYRLGKVREAKWHTRVGKNIIEGQNKAKLLTEYDYEKMKDLYEKGISIQDISKFYNLGWKTIQKYLSEKNVKFRGNNLDFTEEDIQEMKNMYENYKQSLEEISSVYDTYPATIRRKLESINVKIRDMAEVTALKDYTNVRENVHGWTEEELSKLKDMYINKRMSLTEMERELGITKRAISKRLKYAGVVLRSNSEAKKGVKVSRNYKFTEELIQECKRLYSEEKLGIQEIIRKLNIPLAYQTVHNKLIGYGLEMRSKTEAVQLSKTKISGIEWTPELLKNIYNDYNKNNLSLREVATKYNTSKETIRKKLSEYK